VISGTPLKLNTATRFESSPVVHLPVISGTPLKRLSVPAQSRPVRSSPGDLRDSVEADTPTPSRHTRQSSSPGDLRDSVEACVPSHRLQIDSRSSPGDLRDSVEACRTALGRFRRRVHLPVISGTPLKRLRDAQHPRHGMFISR